MGFFDDAYNAVTDARDRVIGVHVDAARNAYDYGSDAVTAHNDYLRSFGGQVGEGVRDRVESAQASYQGATQSLRDTISGAFTGARDAIEGASSTARWVAIIGVVLLSLLVIAAVVWAFAALKLTGRAVDVLGPGLGVGLGHGLAAGVVPG